MSKHNNTSYKLLRPSERNVGTDLFRTITLQSVFVPADFSVRKYFLGKTYLLLPYFFCQTIYFSNYFVWSIGSFFTDFYMTKQPKWWICIIIWWKSIIHRIVRIIEFHHMMERYHMMKSHHMMESHHIMESHHMALLIAEIHLCYSKL